MSTVLNFDSFICPIIQYKDDKFLLFEQFNKEIYIAEEFKTIYVVMELRTTVAPSDEKFSKLFQFPKITN